MYSTKGISYFRCYRIGDIARMYKKSDKTILGWIDSGLKRIDGHKPFLVRGYDLAEFLKSRNDTNRCALEFSEFYCFGCKEARNPKQREITIATSAGGAIRAQAVCPECGKIMCRPYAMDKFSELKKIFVIKEKLCISDSETSPSNFQIQPIENNTENGTKEQVCFPF